MTEDAQRYLDQARSFAAQAELAATEEARHGFLRLAAAFAELAREPDDRRDAA